MKSKFIKHTSPAFILMELAIVIVVVGLLAGGVAVGFQVMESAKIRGTVSQIGEYTNAVTAFRDQYFGWPGDISNAGSLWPDCDATPANCNGNGNGVIDSTAESYRAWQQMRMAELVSGPYSGTSTSGQSVIGTNVPKANIDGVGFSLFAVDTSWVNFYISGQVTAATNVMIIGKPATNSITSAAGINTAYSQEVDQKVDDGFPSSGIMTSSSNGSCPNGNTPPGYNAGQTGVFCALVMELQ